MEYIEMVEESRANTLHVIFQRKLGRFISRNGVLCLKMQALFGFDSISYVHLNWLGRRLWRWIILK